jgi:hypothetical protein
MLKKIDFHALLKAIRMAAEGDELTVLMSKAVGMKATKQFNAAVPAITKFTSACLKYGLDLNLSNGITEGQLALLAEELSEEDAQALIALEQYVEEMEHVSVSLEKQNDAKRESLTKKLASTLQELEETLKIAVTEEQRNFLSDSIKTIKEMQADVLKTK